MTEAYYGEPYDINEYGYSGDEWDLFPDETKEAIIADSEDDFAVVDPDDCIPSGSTLTAKTTRFQDVTRRTELKVAMDHITEANKRIGLGAITKDHPDYKKIDKKYGISSAIKRGERFDARAEEALIRACGNCAVSACVLRDDYKAFENKYHTAPTRAKFAKKLDADPTAPC
jgi:hypothetical protein